MRNARLIGLTLLLASCTLAAPPDKTDAPDAQEVLAKAKAAVGGAGWDRVHALRSTGTIETGGLKGRLESLTDLTRARFADRYELGPASGAEGFDGKTGWEADSSGQVRMRDSAEERESIANEAYRRSCAWWFPGRWKATIERAGQRSEKGRNFSVLIIKPEGGSSFEIWIDAETFLFDRIVEKKAIETRTDFLSDYREVDGLRLPFAARSTNGDARYDQVSRVEKVDVNPEIADARFAPPPPPPPDFRIANGGTSTIVPFELVNNHIYVEAKLNGRAYRVLCDTGGANVVTPAVARELGVQPQGALEGRGVGEKSEDFALVKLDSVQIGDATVDRQLFAVYDLARLEPAEGISMPGLVGYEIFKRFVVRIDYGRRLLTLTLPSAFTPDRRADVLPFRFDGHTPQVEGSVDGVPGVFDIDTGSRSSLDLLAPFVEKNDLAARYGARLEGVTGWGVGGPTRSLLARSRSLRLGPVDVDGVVTFLSLQKKGAFSSKSIAGNVGAGVLRRFTVTFDYGRQSIYLEPTSVAPGPDSYDRAGMWLNAGAGSFEVMDVVAGGPGAEAGIKAGDRIVAVDGVSSGVLALPVLRRRLRSDPPGTRVRFRVQSGGSEREVSVVLRDLV